MKNKGADSEFEASFQSIVSKISSLGIPWEAVAKLEAIEQLSSCEKGFHKFNSKFAFWYFSGLGIICSLILGFSLYDPTAFTKVVARIWFFWEGIPLSEELCVVDMPSSVQTFFMPPIDCGFCENLTEVERLSNVTPYEFENRFAYSGIPLIVIDGTSDWSAIETFSFAFFKDLYNEDSPAMQSGHRDCMFFPYKTEFKSLWEVFQMSKARAEMKGGTVPWYIGWSNCDKSVTDVLRRHYDRPYFLPQHSESSSTDWIFMGSPGYGAQMHIDKVGFPSWQAQISGRKRWILEPATECWGRCHKLEVIVKTGEIFVIDTNIWYHETLIEGDAMSITIGSEYD